MSAVKPLIFVVALVVLRRRNNLKRVVEKGPCPPFLKERVEVKRSKVSSLSPLHPYFSFSFLLSSLSCSFPKSISLCRRRRRRHPSTQLTSPPPSPLSLVSPKKKEVRRQGGLSPFSPRSSCLSLSLSSLPLETEGWYFFLPSLVTAPPPPLMAAEREREGEKVFFLHG